MERKVYPSDVSDDAWAVVAPYLTLMMEDAPQRDQSLREVLHGLRWMVRAGAAWRLMPHDLPPWYTVYQRSQRWLKAGVFEAMVHDLCALRKVITLCPFCTHKFNPGRLGYIKEKEFPVVQANCDGCSTFDPKCTAYFFEETYHIVRSTATERRATRTAERKRVAKLIN